MSCGEGTTTRVLSRSCTNPSPQYGGKDCSGGYTKTETKPCNDRECPGHSLIDLKKKSELFLFIGRILLVHNVDFICLSFSGDEVTIHLYDKVESTYSNSS